MKRMITMLVGRFIQETKNKLYKEITDEYKSLYDRPHTDLPSLTEGILTDALNKAIIMFIGEE
jgi:hypothetical protein